VQSLQQVHETRRVECVERPLSVASAEAKQLVIGEVKAIHRHVDRGGAQLVSHPTRER
jgi:hypothetical protein